jgi:hypothetical protein
MDEHLWLQHKNFNENSRDLKLNNFNLAVIYSRYNYRVLPDEYIYNLSWLVSYLDIFERESIYLNLCIYTKNWRKKEAKKLLHFTYEIRNCLTMGLGADELQLGNRHELSYVRIYQ